MPAAASPDRPARMYPTWMAISVEFGPGIRLVAPKRSKAKFTTMPNEAQLGLSALGGEGLVHPEGDLKARKEGESGDDVNGGRHPEKIGDDP